MIPRSLNRWLSATCSLIAFILVVAELALGAAASRVPQELMQKARREGDVRVILQLLVSDVGASPIDNEILHAVRRANIAQAQGSLRGALRGVAHRVHHQFRDIPFIVLELGSAGLQTLDSLQGLVSQVFEDKLERPFLSESVPLVQADQLWAGAFGGVPYDGSGTVVAILDTGVDKNHLFLGNVVEEACFSSNNAGFSATSLCPGAVTSSFAAGSALPCNLAIAGCNHGTHVAGIATGDGQNGLVAGFSGVAKGANVMAVQVFSRFDSSSTCSPSATPCVLAFTSDIMAGLQRVYDLRAVQNFASINMSLGGGGSATACDTDPRKPIIDLLRAANIATVIASGNNGFTNQISSPACISSTVSVGSTGDGSFGTSVDAVSSFSNSASFISLLAPGQVINSSVPGTGFANFQGTSMATPHVAGAFAILKQAMPTLTVSEALAALQSGGLPVVDTRNGITKPRIRILNALLSLAITPPDTVITGSPLAVTNLTNADFTFSSSESGGTFACKLDASAFASCTSPKSYTNLAAGSHVFQVRATDANGNTDPTPASYNWTIDVTEPDTTITGGPSGTITTNGASFTWTGSDNLTVTTSLLYAYRLDPIEPSFSAFGAATSKGYNNLANGNYTFFVQARDQATNVDQSPASRPFTVTAAAANPTITLSYDGKVADRVGQGERAQSADRAVDGVFTVVLNPGSGNRTVTRMQLTNGEGVWNTQPSDVYWTLGAASTVGSALLNAANDSVNFAVSDGGSFKIFASDYNGAGFAGGRSFTLTANFADGSSAVGTVMIGATLPMVTIAATTPTAIEGGAAGLFTVTRTGSTSSSLTVNYTVGGTATPVSDYTALSGSSQILAGQSTATIAVNALNDLVSDNNETVIVTLSANAAYTVGSPNSASVTISESSLTCSPNIALSFDGKTADRVGQGEFSQNADGQADGVFTVTLNPGSGNCTVTRMQLTNGEGVWNTQPSDVYWTLGAASTVNGALHNASNDSVNFAPSEGISFKIFASDYNGAGFASGRTFTLTVNFADGSTAVGNVTVGATLPGVTIVATDPMATEAGLTTGSFTVSRTGSTTSSLTVNYTIAGTAGNGSDYQSLSGSVVIAAGQSTAPFTIMPVDDLEAEGDETVILSLSSNAAYTVGSPSSATVTIIDNDSLQGLPTISLSYDGKTADRVGQGEFLRSADGQADGVFTVTLNPGSGNRTVTRMQLTNGEGVWNTQPSDVYWTLGAASTVNGALYNASNDSVNIAVSDGGSFKIFASDYNGTGFAGGRSFTLTVGFADGTSAVGNVNLP